MSPKTKSPKTNLVQERRVLSQPKTPSTIRNSETCPGAPKKSSVDAVRETEPVPYTSELSVQNQHESEVWIDI